MTDTKKKGRGMKEPTAYLDAMFDKHGGARLSDMFQDEDEWIKFMDHTVEAIAEAMSDARRAALDVLRQVREASETYGHQLGCSSAEDDGSGCDCILSEMAMVRALLDDAGRAT